MTTVLKHEATSFSMVVDGMKAAEVLAAAVTADRQIGLTSLRELLKGSVDTAKGFTIEVVDGESAAEPEVPVAVDEATPEWNHAALMAAHPGNKVEPVVEPKVKKAPASDVPVEWGEKGECSDSVLASKTARLTRKWNRISGSDKFKATKVVLNTFKVGRTVSDYFEIHDSEGALYTVFPKKRGDDSAEAEVYHRADEFKDPVISGGWGYVVRYFMGE